MARNLIGVVTNRDPSLCMVAECSRKALYKSAERPQSERGYCAEHKHLAIRTGKGRHYQDIPDDYLNTWVPSVKARE